MRTKEAEAYMLDELTINLCDKRDVCVHTAYAMNLPVLVQFEYEHGSVEEDNEPQIYNMQITSASGDTLGGERITVTPWAGCDLTGFLTHEQFSKVEGAMYDRMKARAQEESDAARIDEAEQQRQERAWAFGDARSLLRGAK